MQKYIDAHCHIGCGATDASVAMFFCNSVTESDWLRVLSAAGQGTAVHPCLGLHPLAVATATAGWNARLRTILAANPHCMVGEIGLDKSRPNYEVQMDAFLRQMQIATELQRVVHIHCVRAWGDMLNILTDKKFRTPAIVLHGFAGAVEIMARLAQMDNVYFSFGRAVCDARRARLPQTVRATPPSRILIESDGDMCDASATLRRVLARIAEIRDMSVDGLSRTIYDNSIRVMTQNG